MVQRTKTNAPVDRDSPSEFYEDLGILRSARGPTMTMRGDVPWPAERAPIKRMGEREGGRVRKTDSDRRGAHPLPHLETGQDCSDFCAIESWGEGSGQVIWVPVNESERTRNRNGLRKRAVCWREVCIHSVNGRTSVAIEGRDGWIAVHRRVTDARDRLQASSQGAVL